MKKAISAHKKSRGRPATGHDPSVSTRFPADVMARIVAWAAKQKDGPPRSEAIRRLVEIALKSETPSTPVPRPGRRLRAQELAGNVIEKMIDPTASPDE